MTADQITEYKVIDIRNQLYLAAEAMDEIFRDIRNSDTTPESAAARVNAEIAKINKRAIGFLGYKPRVSKVGDAGAGGNIPGDP